jgi:hypothetical protein
MCSSTGSERLSGFGENAQNQVDEALRLESSRAAQHYYRQRFAYLVRSTGIQLDKCQHVPDVAIKSVPSFTDTFVTFERFKKLKLRLCCLQM